MANDGEPGKTDCEKASGCQIQVWLENRLNFVKMLLQCGRSSKNCFLLFSYS